MPTKQPKYQQLRAGNAQAAINITLALKKNKALSEESFGRLYAEANNIHYKCHGSFDQLMNTTKKFLEQHGVMTFTQINGLNFWIATQKCVHAKMGNMFIEYQYVSNEDIDLAIAWQKNNKGLIPAEIEGKVIAVNILGLTGKTAEIYAKTYTMHSEAIDLWDNHHDRKYAILGPLRDIKQIKKI